MREQIGLERAQQQNREERNTDHQRRHGAANTRSRHGRDDVREHHPDDAQSDHRHKGDSLQRQQGAHAVRAAERR